MRCFLPICVLFACLGCGAGEAGSGEQTGSQKSSMRISRNKVVLFDYTLRDDAGQVLDTTNDGEPFPYLHGADMVVSGLEEALAGKCEGDSFEITLQPEDAHGVRDESLRLQVDREQFNGVDNLAVGSQFRIEDGDKVVTVLEIGDERVTVDGNHALAGLTLHYDITVRGVRAATEKEIEDGHPKSFAANSSSNGK